MKLKTLLCVALCVVTSFAVAEDDEFATYVDVLYDISKGESSTLVIGGKEYVVYGAKIGATRMPLSDAIQDYTRKYAELSGILAGSQLNNLIRANTLANWGDAMREILYDGFAAYKDNERAYVDSLYGSAITTDQLNETKDETATRISNMGVALSAQIDSVATSFRNELSSMQELATSLKGQLQQINTRISELSAKSNKTQEEIAELSDLKKQAERVSVLEAASQKAKTQLQQVSVRVATLETQVAGFVSRGASTNNWKAVSAWLGQKDTEERKNNGVFLEPAKVDKGDASGSDSAKDSYNYKKKDTIFTMLEDLGIAPVVNDKQRTAWKELGQREPDRYFYIDATDRSGAGVKCFARPSGSFPAPSNWVDGETITCSNGVYSASGSSYANVAKTIQAYLNNANASGVKGAGSDAQIGDDSLWSTNNTKNPANENFDKEDRTNPWNLITYTGDSSVSPKDVRHLNSISFLGEYSSAFGNAFSLYGFYNAPDGAIPYVSRDDTESTLCWKNGLEADGGESNTYGERTKTIQILKSHDSDSTEVDAELPRYISLYGFGDTATKKGMIPYKASETTLGWKTDGVKIVGTDKSTNWSGDEDPAQTITFASASDSNVKVTVSGTKNDATVTIGVYYK